MGKNVFPLLMENVMEFKRGQVFRWSDNIKPIVVDYADSIFVWCWYGESRRPFDIPEFRKGILNGDLVPFCSPDHSKCVECKTNQADLLSPLHPNLCADCLALQRQDEPL